MFIYYFRACSEGDVQVRRAFFSATLPPDVEEWCSLNLDNVASVTIGERHAATETIQQSLVYTGTEKGKLLAFRQLIESGGLKPPVLVFVQEKERAKELFTELIKEKIHVDVIHSERSQLQRDNTVKAFRAGQIWVLICTELMGRGIDFKVNCIIGFGKIDKCMQEAILCLNGTAFILRARKSTKGCQSVTTYCYAIRFVMSGGLQTLSDRCF